MKKYVYVALTTILMVVCTANTRAQKLETTIIWSGAQDCQPAFVNDTWHIIEGTKATITLNAEIPESTNEKRYENNIVYKKEDNILESNIDTFTPSAETTNYTATFLYKNYTYDEKTTSWVTDNVIHEEVSPTKTFTFITYERPTLASMSVSADLAYTYIGGNTRAITVDFPNPASGLTSKIEWTLDNNKTEEIGKEYTFIPTNEGDAIIKAKVTILAPDKTTVWASDEKSISILVYSTPKIQTVNLTTDSKYTYIGGTRTLKLGYTYSPETLPVQIEWYVDGEKDTSANKEDFTYKPSTVGNHQITAKVIILDPEKKTIWNEGKISSAQTITVYENPSSVISPQTLKSFIAEPSKTVAYITQDIKFSYSIATPDDRYQWDYTWKFAKQSFSGQIATFNNPAEEGKYMATLTVQAKNPDKSGELWGEPITCETNKSINIFNLPAPVYTEQDMHMQPSSSHEYALYVGEEFDATLLYSVSGGSPTGWKAMLTVNGEEQQSTKFVPSQKGNYNISLTVCNYAPGTTETLMENKTTNYTLYVYDKPKWSTNLGQIFDTNSSVLHVVSGDDITFKIDVDGGDISGWNVSYSESDNTLTALEGTEANRYHTFNYINTSTKEQTHDIKIHISNEIENQAKTSQLYSEDIERQIVVWKDICANIDEPIKDSDGENLLETRQGDAQRLLVSLFGGDIKKWAINTTCTENIAGFASQDGNQYAYDIPKDKLKSDGDNAKTYVFNVKAKYRDGQTQIDKDLHIKVHVWPEPTIEQTLLLSNKPGVYFIGSKTTTSNYQYRDIHCYEEDKLALSTLLSGGTPNGAWRYQIDNGDKLPIPSDNIIPTRGMEEIRFYNYITEDSYLTKEKMVLSVSMSCTRYSQPQISTSKMPDVDKTTLSDWNKAEILEDNRAVTPVDLYGDGSQIVNFDFSPTNGNEGNIEGWSYTWKRNDDVLSHNAYTWNHAVETSTTEPYEDIVLSVEIKNVCPETAVQLGNNVGLSLTKSYKVRVWHKVAFPASINMIDMQNASNDMSKSHSIRKGNTMQVHVTPISYGYAPNGVRNYQYSWTDNVPNNSTTNWTSVATNSQTADVFGYDTYSYGLTMRNIGPRGTYWDEKNLEYNVNVYNSPQTPLSLTKKGNGTSGTMIVTTRTSDVNLEKNDYYLVFGYTNASGETKFDVQKQVNNGQVRWTNRYQSQTEMASAFVYAVWIDKESKVLVTSGRRYMNGTDEDWDDSDYNYLSGHSNTRSIIDNKATSVDDIVDEDLTSKDMQVYDTNGILVGTTTKGLASGIYIIRYTQDGVVKSKKISVK